MGNVIQGRFITTVDTTPDSVLDGAKRHELDVVYVIGEKDGEPYFAGSSSDVGHALVLFEKFKRAVIE